MTKLARITKAYKRGENLAMSIHVHLCYLIKHLCKCTFNNHFYRSLITQTCIFHICIQSQFHFVMPKILVPFLKNFFAVLLISFLSKWIGQQGLLRPGLLDCTSFRLRARVSLSIGPISMLHWLTRWKSPQDDAPFIESRLGVVWGWGRNKDCPHMSTEIPTGIVTVFQNWVMASCTAR